MLFLLNLLLALLTFFGVKYLMEQVGSPRPLALIVGVLLGIVVFIANFGAQIVG